MNQKTRVVKVGGSLLTWDELPSRLESWLDAQPTATTVMVAGGGPWVELIRQADKRFSLDEAAAHCMCVQAMSVTARLLAEICACRVVTTLAELESEIRASGSAKPIVFDVQEWLLQGPTQDLPKSWRVTSDSIAARLAAELDADDLVLFKSCPATSSDLSALAAENYVDDYFPTAAAATVERIRFENLR